MQQIDAIDKFENNFYTTVRNKEEISVADADRLWFDPNWLPNKRS